MGLFGSLITGVSGLKSQSIKMGAVSDNIANVSTVGYKRVDVQFSTLVTERLSSNSFQPGGVMARPRQMVSEQGILSQSSTNFDMAVSGQGLFTVTNDPESSSPDQFYTRAGSFRPDEDLRLKNSSGYFLQAFPTDNEGTPLNPTTSTGNLEVVSLEDHLQYVQGTSKVKMKTNLPADSVPTVTMPASTESPAGAGRFVNVAIQNPPDYQQTFDVYDDQGIRHSVTYNYTRVDTGAGGAPNVWMIQVDKADITGAKDMDTAAAGEQPPEANFHVKTQNAAGVVQDIVTNTVYVQFDGKKAMKNMYVPSHALAAGDDFTTNPPLGADPAGANFDAVINQTTSPTEPPVMMRTLIGNVTLDGVDDPDATLVGGAFENHITITPGSDPVSSTTTSPFGTNGAQGLSFTVDVGRPTELNGAGSAHAGTGLDGMTNFASKKTTPDVKINFFSQDGSPPTDLVGIQVDVDGLMSAVYANGQTKAIYQVVLANFNNVNGLYNESGNVYRESVASGDVTLRRPGENASGVIQDKALENSNVDLGDEFASMIITQQAYTANTRTVSTADQMLQELVNIIR